ncbi:hypothetical protein QQS21_006730 [Conoideocrella luteorostrata]|uniref:Uncharacterized protein n=1 Tax=Conoideocrella luteorostrata TaxID=1105319 RepID=A0AAJ0FSP1_9HYPO|nr:hypothetical protein QQS21_006730 [Conoideocrella luteorostrata]
MASSSPVTTPKRKRGEDVAINPIKFSFDLSQPEPTEEESGSPRSKVAHRFRGLALGSGGGVQDDDGDDNGSADATRKRQKSDAAVFDGAEADRQGQMESQSPTPLSRPLVGVKTQEAVAVAAVASPFELPPTPLDETNEAEDSSQRRNRAGTPPLKLKRSPIEIREDKNREDQITEFDSDDDIIDPIRAALTWHEDEITIYDPDDDDDDGTGINGIGFRPTPALAHARAMRRRQQITDYRKREEGEARARRNQRRRGEEALSVRPKKKSSPRKVHFIDSERQNLALTTQ